MGTNKDKLPFEFSYKPLWKLLIDRGIKKQQLQKKSGVSAATIAKMGRCENVMTDVVLKICIALDCSPNDIMEIVPRKEDSKKLVTDDCIDG